MYAFLLFWRQFSKCNWQRALTFGLQRIPQQSCWKELQQGTCTSIWTTVDCSLHSSAWDQSINQHAPFFDLHISQYLWTLSIFVSAHIFGRFTMHMLADHKLVQSTSTNGILVWMVCWFIKFKINYEATSNSPLARLSTTTGSSLSSSEASRWDSRIKQARYKMLISDL